MEILFLVGRVLFGGFFVLSGINHFLQAGNMVPYARSKGLPAAPLAVYGSGALLLAGGLSVLLGYLVPIGVAALVLFLVPTSLLMHNFWTVDDPEAQAAEMTQFMKNVALLGASLMFLLVQTWPLSLGG